MICSEEGWLPCKPGCGLTFCSGGHLRLHLGEGGECLPFTITRREGVGRCALAARDIRPGELIFR